MSGPMFNAGVPVKHDELTSARILAALMSCPPTRRMDSLAVATRCFTDADTWARFVGREPLTSDGPDFHAEHAAWSARQARTGSETDRD